VLYVWGACCRLEAVLSLLFKHELTPFPSFLPCLLPSLPFSFSLPPSLPPSPVLPFPAPKTSIFAQLRIAEEKNNMYESKMEQQSSRITEMQDEMAQQYVILSLTVFFNQLNLGLWIGFREVR
jgi:hypothetical protein